LLITGERHCGRRISHSSVDRTFVPTLPILEQLREHDIGRLEYLPNGVDLTLFSPRRRSEEWRQQRLADKKPVVLFVSRLVWEKDLAVLARAYEILRSRGCEFEMVIVGDGHAREEFQAMMPGAHFLGYQTGETLAESYASSDIFVFPSTTETFGLVTLEAMASGLAPVAAKVGGATGIIEDGRSGLFAAPLNASELADAVAFLIAHPDERCRIAAAALQRAQEFILGWGPSTTLREL
jgi:phosphatidylinositol alpha 1,6-mannosyltransferase